jgi:AcrR family transcriptional regulator
MPRIAAASIDEHVRIQNERITAAARRLFAGRGFAATDMGQIASSIGLARNSLYRYYPNKDHILLACIREDMEPHLARLERLQEEYPVPRERLMVWLDLQFALATGPAHATMELMAEVRDASVKLSKDVRRLHELPNAALVGALNELRTGDNATLAAMIGGMVLAATSHALEQNEPGRTQILRTQVLNELKNAVGLLI